MLQGQTSLIRLVSSPKELVFTHKLQVQQFAGGDDWGGKCTFHTQAASTSPH